MVVELLETGRRLSLPIMKQERKTVPEGCSIWALLTPGGQELTEMPTSQNGISIELWLLIQMHH
jgi:hypothetical protein